MVVFPLSFAVELRLQLLFQLLHILGLNMPLCGKLVVEGAEHVCRTPDVRAYINSIIVAGAVVF